MATICDEEPPCSRYMGCGNASSLDNEELVNDDDEKEKSSGIQENNEPVVNSANNALNQIKPLSVNNDRRNSVHLFAKPETESAADESGETSVDELEFKRTAIHHAKDGEQSVFEVSE